MRTVGNPQGELCQPVNAVPLRQFLHIELKGVIIGNVSRIDVATQILVPARDTLSMSLNTESVQVSLTDRQESEITLPGRTEFGLFRQQIITEIITFRQKIHNLSRQANRCIRVVSGFRRLRCFLFRFLPFR